MNTRAKTLVDAHAKNDLDLFVENTRDLYPQKKAIITGMMRRMRRGAYDPSKASKAWEPWVEEGAKLYAKEFQMDAPWHETFPKPLREELAVEIARDIEEKIKLGEYDHLLPPKDQTTKEKKS